MLNAGFHDVPDGHVATIVTYLEMTAPPEAPAPSAFSRGVTLVRQPVVDLAAYSDLFLRVGGLPWLWWSRLILPKADLARILAEPSVAVWFVMRGGKAEGLLELDFREDSACELAYFGLTGALIGTGTGRALMAFAIAEAFARPIARFHVHTCTLDSPKALDFYRQAGFAPVRQQVEIAPDPRCTGHLPPQAGPHVPVFPGAKHPAGV